MSKLEQVLISMLELFEEFSGTDDKMGQMSLNEFRSVLEKELSDPALKEKFNPEEIDELMKMLDKNRDNQINFREFCRFVSQLARAYKKAKKNAKK